MSSRAQEPADFGPFSVIQFFWYRTVIEVTSQQFFGCFSIIFAGPSSHFCCFTVILFGS